MHLGQARKSGLRIPQALLTHRTKNRTKNRKTDIMNKDGQGKSAKVLRINIPANANDNEIWMPIDGYEGYYSISSFGNVRSETRTIPHKRFKMAVHKGKTITPTKRKTGSHECNVVSFTKHGNHRIFLVHQLVARAFLENPNDCPFVNHVDGNHLNNKLNNLEWINQQDSIKRAYRLGLIQAKRGAQNPGAKLTEDNVRQIRQYIAQKAFTQRKIAQMFGVVEMVISDIKLGKTWKQLK
jgi:hypothetical protein